MNDENKKFIEDFQNRVANYPQYDRIVSGVDEKRNEIVGAINTSIRFLNDDVLATGTSSLQRTSVEVPDSMKSSYDKSEKQIITFNHKGIGSLRLATAGSYGTNFSKELRTEAFLGILADDTTRQAIINELITNKQMKLLKRFNDVCSTIQELKEMESLSNKYRDAGISYVFKEPQVVYKPSMEVDDNDSGNANHYIKLDRLIVEKISLEKSDLFSVHITMTDEEMEKARDKYEHKYNSRRGQEVNQIFFTTGAIETSMFLMQFPDEVRNALDEIQKMTNADHARIVELSDSVNSKLAEYAVMATLKEDK